VLAKGDQAFSQRVQLLKKEKHMNTTSVPQSFIERQLFSVAYELIQAVIDLKSDHRYRESSLLEIPHLKGLLNKLDTWTNMKLDMEGGL
jgi:hypothetical protein